MIIKISHFILKKTFAQISVIDLGFNEKILKIPKSDPFCSLLFDLYNRRDWFEAEIHNIKGNERIISVVPIAYKNQLRLDNESLRLRGGSFLYPTKDHEEQDQEETAKVSNEEQIKSTTVPEKDNTH